MATLARWITLLFLVATPAAADQSCLVAAHRVLGFLRDEAKGTRHEAQIANSIKAKGEGSVVAGIAAGLTSDQCALLILAPDSTVRALAISMLPERNGQ